MKTEPRNMFLTRNEIALTRADGFFDGLDDLTVSNELNGSLSRPISDIGLYHGDFCDSYVIDDRGIGWHNFL